MARRKGSIEQDSNIELLADAPLDARSIVAAKSDLTAGGTFDYTYVGMVVAVQDEGKLYVLTAKPYTNIDNWKAVGSDDGGETIQVDALPTASAEEEGKIYQYTGATTSTLTNGYFYKCVSDGEDPATYSWVEKEVQTNEDVPHWSGTLTEYEAQKNSIPEGAYVALTDDIDQSYESGDYSLNEVNTGKRWIDGKPIYRKVIDFGALPAGLPDHANKQVPHNIANVEYFTYIGVVTYNPTDGRFFRLPLTSIDAVGNQISMSVNNTVVSITAGTDRSQFAQTYITLEYTKTTD